MRGSPDLGRDGTNLQKPGQGILSSGQWLQFGPGLGGSLEVSEKKAQAGQPLLPWDSSGHLGTGQPPKVHQSLPTLGTRVPRRVRGAREGSWVPTADLEWLLGRSLIQSEKKSAQHSHHRVQKNPKPGTRRMARPPQPTQGVPRRIYVQRVLDGSNTREGEQRALTPKPAGGGDPGDPRGKRPGWPGPAAAGGCRTDGEVGGVSTMGRRGGTHRPRAPRAEVAAASEGTVGDARSRGV